MKSNLRATGISIAALLMISSATAIVLWPFPGWDSLLQASPDVVLVRCVKTFDPNVPNPDGSYPEILAGVIDSEVKTEVVLKGGAKPGPSVVRSRAWPRQAEWCMVLGRYESGCYQAYDDYRVIDLGIDFPTNIAAGKTLEEQVKAVLDYRLKKVNGQLQKLEEEKQRLEGALMKRKQ